MVDNFNLIKSFLDFSEKDTFYFLQIIQRKKDGNDNIKDNIIIKDFFIKSIKHFEDIYPQIKFYCDTFNARAYIRLNKVFYDKVAFETLCLISEMLKTGNTQSVKSAYTTACGRKCYDKDKKWIIDIDDIGVDIDDIYNVINNSMSKNVGYNILGKIPTKNGFHLITIPFDCREFKNKYSDIDIHKNNPTILYVP